MEWDDENHLSAVKNGSTSIESYLYDADGMRVKKSGCAAATYYINAFYEVTIDIPPTPTPTPPPTATPTRTPTPRPTPTRNCRYEFCTPTPPASSSLVGQGADLASAATPMPERLCLPRQS